MEDNFAPYAPTKSVMLPINRYREKGLPFPLDAKGLEQVSVPGTMANRTLAALRFLELITDDGMPTEGFERLKRAGTEEYPKQLAEIVQGAYLPIFSIVNPAVDSETAIADAFRRYEPHAQRGKMISLFRGLCMEAGLTENTPRQRSGGRPPKPKSGTDEARAERKDEKKATPSGDPLQSMFPGAFASSEGVDLRVITAVLHQLPREPHWSAARRERWFLALTSAVDLMFEIDEEASSSGGGGGL